MSYTSLSDQGSVTFTFDDGTTQIFPAWLAKVINQGLATIVGKVSHPGTLSSVSHIALQFSMLARQGTDQSTHQTLLESTCDDIWQCGNEIKPFPIKHPHWTDIYQELEQYAASYPESSMQYSSALHACNTLLMVVARRTGKFASTPDPIPSKL